LSVIEPDGELARVESVGEPVGHRDFIEDDDPTATDIAHTGFKFRDSFLVHIGSPGAAALPWHAII
jgi:hypothetical protein